MANGPDVRIRLSGLQLVAAGLERGALVLDFVGPTGRRRRRRRHPFGNRVFSVRIPAGTFFDARLLDHLDDWQRGGAPLCLRATRGGDGRLHRFGLDDGHHRLSMRVRWPDPVSGRIARRRSAPAAAPAATTPPGSA